MWEQHVLTLVSSHEILKQNLVVYHCIALHVVPVDLIARCILLHRSIPIMKIAVHVDVVTALVLRQQRLFILLLCLIDNFFWAVLSLFFCDDSWLQ